MVPLTMPSTRSMRSPTSDSRSGRMSGMPPATAASNSRSTPAASAAANSSAPTLASSSLLPVTTGLPAARAARIERAGRLDAADHLDDDVDARVGDDVGGVGGEHAVGQLDAALLAGAAHGDARPPRGARRCGPRSRRPASRTQLDERRRRRCRSPAARPARSRSYDRARVVAVAARGRSRCSTSRSATRRGRTEGAGRCAGGRRPARPRRPRRASIRAARYCERLRRPMSARPSSKFDAARRTPGSPSPRTHRPLVRRHLAPSAAPPATRRRMPLTTDVDDARETRQRPGSPACRAPPRTSCSWLQMVGDDPFGAARRRSPAGLRRASGPTRPTRRGSRSACGRPGRPRACRSTAASPTPSRLPARTSAATPARWA